MSDAPANQDAYVDPLNDPLTDHEYDGIREFDNPTPGWWNWLFIGSFFFAVFYFTAYQLGTAGTSVAESYEIEKTEVSKRLISLLGDLSVDEPTILANLHNQDLIAVGASLFATNCVSCHGKDGEGLVGPNMTDDYYKNVKTLGDIGTVIQNGAANGAMPAWNNRMASTEIVAAAVYIANKRGQNLPGPRGIEGDLAPPWPEATAVTAPVESAE